MTDLKLRMTAEGFDKASKPFKGIIQTSRKMREGLANTTKELKGLRDAQKRMTGFATLKRQTADTTKQLALAKTEARNLAIAHKQAERPTRAMGLAAERAAKQVGVLKNKEQAQRRELQQQRGALSRAGVDTKHLGREQARLAQRIGDATRHLDRQQKALKRAAHQQQRLAAAGAKYRRTLQTQSNLAVAGAAGVAGGGTALRGLASTIQPGMSFDAQMSAVGAIARIEKTSAAFGALRSQALALGNTTSFSASQAAEGMEFLAMAGFEAQEVMASMPGMLNLAKAGRMELGETANIASNILSAFGLEAGRMDEVADTLAATFSRANVKLGQLGETMSYVAPAAFEAGASMQEASAMAGLLGDVGIQASAAGTVLRSLYTRMAAPPTAAAKALGSLSIRTTDAAGNLRAMPEILAEVARKTESLGNAERLGLFTAIAGKMAGSGMAALVRQEGAEGITKFVGVLSNAQGEAQRIANLMGDNLSGDVIALGSAYEGLNIALADTQTFSLRHLVQGITSMVRGVTAWARENPRLAGTLFTLAGVVASVWAVAGGLAIAVAGILGPFALAKFAAVTLGLKAATLASSLKLVGSAVWFIGKALLFNPIGLAIVGIAAAAYLVWRYWEPIKSFFGGLWEHVTNTFKGGLAGIGAAIVNWSPIGLFYRGMAGALSFLGVELPETFTGFGAALVDGLVSGITSGIGKIMATVRNLAGGIKAGFADLLGINSPSRVFADFGGFITQGLTQGVQGGQARAVSAVGQLGRALPRAAAIGAVAASVAAVPAYAGAGTQTSATSQTIEIHVHAAPGMNEHELARLVANELAKIERTRAASARSAFHD